MDNKTRAALEASIKRWEGEARRSSLDGVNLRRKSCPLCNEFMDGVIQDCERCPVGVAGHLGCRDTPYEAAEVALEFDDIDLFRYSARDEVEFLKSLLPE